MGITPWTKSELLERYQHLTDAVRSDIAGRVGALLWTPHDVAAPTSQASSGTRPHGAADPE